MPFQVNGQSVTTKSSRLLHVAAWAGAFADAAGKAFVAMASSAAASAAPASPKMIAAETANIFTRPLPNTIGREADPILLPQQSCSVNSGVLHGRDHVASLARHLPQPVSDPMIENSGLWLKCYFRRDDCRLG